MDKKWFSIIILMAFAVILYGQKTHIALMSLAGQYPDVIPFPQLFEFLPLFVIASYAFVVSYRHGAIMSFPAIFLVMQVSGLFDGNPTYLATWTFLGAIIIVMSCAIPVPFRWQGANILSAVSHLSAVPLWAVYASSVESPESISFYMDYLVWGAIPAVLILAPIIWNRSGITNAFKRK